MSQLLRFLNSTRLTTAVYGPCLPIGLRPYGSPPVGHISSPQRRFPPAIHGQILVSTAQPKAFPMPYKQPQSENHGKSCRQTASVVSVVVPLETVVVPLGTVASPFGPVRVSLDSVGGPFGTVGDGKGPGAAASVAANRANLPKLPKPAEPIHPGWSVGVAVSPDPGIVRGPVLGALTQPRSPGMRMSLQAYPPAPRSLEFARQILRAEATALTEVADRLDDSLRPGRRPAGRLPWAGGRHRHRQIGRRRRQDRRHPELDRHPRLRPRRHPGHARRPGHGPSGRRGPGPVALRRERRSRPPARARSTSSPRQ